jgi:hypothetical protein
MHEIAKALSLCSPDDPTVADLKRRMLHLKEELEWFSIALCIEASLQIGGPTEIEPDKAAVPTKAGYHTLK